MTIEEDELTVLKCNTKPRVNVTYTLAPAPFPLHFHVIENGIAVGELLREDPYLTLAVKGEPRLQFEKRGRHDEHALAYGILFIIIVLSVAIYYTKF